ncbi:MAG: WHG domain-containing protein [Roseburia sp.]|nr:WHG domain-containing protein [Roseburia sp.]
MPPKAKFTQEEIIEAAFRIVRTQGVDKLTARELGSRLGSSARPIFTVFETMDELKAEVIARAKELYGRYIDSGLQQELAFQGVGMAYIRFSLEEPMLFRLLFMSAVPGQIGVESILPQIDDSYERILQSVSKYVDSREAADMIYQHLWTYTHGIATMCATGLCSYTMEQIQERLRQIFVALMMMEKGAHKKDDKN